MSFKSIKTLEIILCQLNLTIIDKCDIVYIENQVMNNSKTIP